MKIGNLLHFKIRYIIIDEAVTRYRLENYRTFYARNLWEKLKRIVAKQGTVQKTNTG